MGLTMTKNDTKKQPTRLAKVITAYV